MSQIKQEIFEKVMERQNDSKVLLDIIGQYSELRKEGKSYRAECPKCHGHSLVVTPGKGFKCFGCNEVSGRNAYQFLISQGKDKMAVITELANTLGIVLEYEEEPKSKKREKPGSSEPFWSRMLKASGLTKQDVTAKMRTEKDGTTDVLTFMPGTMTPKGDIIDGDDCVIQYLDLKGNPVTYVSKYDSNEKPRPYYRVRYQNPELHKDQKEGKAMKYRTPYGAPAFIYYPQRIRACYEAATPIDRLFIQEGEKKAEKATKHGILSVAVSGIQNIASGGKLPEDLIELIRRCNVKEVVFLLDSDCRDLSTSLNVNKPIDTRPRGFFNAVKNYKEYFDTLKNLGIYVEILYGYVKKNDAGDKGIDDLLANSLKGNEDVLAKDIEEARNRKPMAGQYVYLKKISTMTDNKLLEEWNLHSAKEFCTEHFAELKDMPEFTFGRRKYRFNEAGEFESAQPLEPDEQFWSISTNKDGKQECYFDYDGCKNFLEHRGYYRYGLPNSTYEYVHAENNIVETVKPHQIADFVKTFAKDTLPKVVRQMLYKGNVRYFGDATLSMLDYFGGDFDTPQKGRERLFFRDTIWEVSEKGIKEMSYTQMNFNIWTKQKKDYAVKRLPELIKITKEEDHWSYEITSEGKKCDFLRFLENTSNFSWRKEEVTEEDKLANAQHFISKLAAFGYLIARAKDKSVSKAVIGMDGKQSEVGVSNGRSGKSLLGEACRVVVNTLYKNGKEFRGGVMPNFVWDGLTDRVRIVFLDDTPRDFDFEGFFPMVTGDWSVNPKNATPFTIPWADSPKVYQATNHANTGDGDSFEDRQWLLAFSDFYNAKHKPIDDFGRHFFSDEWDESQWNLFWNMVATALQVYFRYGYIPSPGDRLEKRKLIQEIGEEFILWADTYFSEPANPGDSSRLNQIDIPRKEIYDNLLEEVNPSRRSFYSPRSFSTKLQKYCELKGYYYNPQIYDPNKKKYAKCDRDGNPIRRIVRNGIEYITIGNADFYKGGMTYYSEDGTPVATPPAVSDEDAEAWEK